MTVTFSKANCTRPVVVTPGNSLYYCYSTQHCITSALGAELSVTKLCVSPLNAGTDWSINCTITAANQAGDPVLTGVDFYLGHSAGFPTDYATLSAATGLKASCASAQLNAGDATLTCEVTLQFTAGQLTAGGLLELKAGFADANTSTAVISSAAVSIEPGVVTVTATPSTPISALVIGDVVSVDVVVANEGPNAATGITVTATGMTFVAADPCLAAIATIPVNTSTACVATYTVTAADMDGALNQALTVAATSTDTKLFAAPVISGSPVTAAFLRTAVVQPSISDCSISMGECLGA